MQRIFILFSIGIFLTLIYYSTSTPRKVRSLENDEFDNMMKKIGHQLKPYGDEDSMDENDDDETIEEKKKKMKYLENSEESNSDSNEQEKEDDDDDEHDKQAILSHFIDIDHEKVSENNGEK